MAVIYVKEQGAYLNKVGERIVVNRNAQALLDVPVFHIDNIALIGNVQVTTQALHMLMEQGVDVSYFSYGGKYLGHTAAEASKNIFLRFEQYGYYLDMEKRLEMAKTIIRNKIDNQIAVISHHRWTGSSHDHASDLKRLQELQEKALNMQTPNQLLGIEGLASQIYFGAFGQMLKCDFRFDGRNRRPPRDPVNVILSLAYTFLTKEVSSVLDAESFETYLGFLHGIRYGRKSLALDIVEEFRQPVIDRLVLLLFNKRMIGRYDFDFPEEGRIVLNEDGFTKFCREYEKWMSGSNSLSGDDVSFKKRIREQVASLKKAITQGHPYHPYHPYRWEDKRHASHQL